jgi:hypothetical protein
MGKKKSGPIVVPNKSLNIDKTKKDIESRKTKLHVFLDINGVINNRASVLEGVYFLPEKVKLVNILLFDYNPVLVICSDWKHVYSEEKLKFALDMAGLLQTVDVTSTVNISYYDGKEAEILDYINEYELDKNQFIILDDKEFFDPLITSHHVRVNPETGLTYDDINVAKIIFDLQPN